MANILDRSTDESFGRRCGDDIVYSYPEFPDNCRLMERPKLRSSKLPGNNNYTPASERTALVLPKKNSVMNYIALNQMKDQLRKNWKRLPETALQSFLNSFDIEYVHNSTAIEGNTLTLIETKTVLEDKLSIGGKSLCEIYEVINHSKAFSYVKACVAKQESLSESISRNIHEILMENILVGGIYRNCEIRITGARHKPPADNEMYSQIKAINSSLPNHPELNSIELAAYTHAEFVRIHPFEDGNGRTARLIMNYQLMISGFLPRSIRKEVRLQYFETLEQYASEGNLQPFSDLIADLEEKQIRVYMSLLPKEREGDER